MAATIVAAVTCCALLDGRVDRKTIGRCADEATVDRRRKNEKGKKKEKSEKQKLTATPSLREPNNQFRSNDGRRLYQEENVEIRRCAGAFF